MAVVPARLLKRVAALDPELPAALDAAVAAASATVDERLVDLVERRVAVLLGDEEARAAWSDADPRDEAAQACANLVDQFVIDVSGVTDADVAAVAAHLPSAQLLGFVSALYVVELTQRIDLALAAVLDEAPA